MKTLYLSDLDGTLLRPNACLSEYTIDTINRFVENGGLFSFVTARSIVSALKVTNGLNLDLPVICANGAFIFSNKTNEILWSNFFDSDEVDVIKRALCDLGVYPVVYAYIDGTEYMTYFDHLFTPAMGRFLNTIMEDPNVRIVKDISELYSGNIFHIVCMDDHVSYDPVKSTLGTDDRFNCFCQEEVDSGDFWFNILPAKATKANAALQLKTMFGIDKIVVFGDQKNDFSLFSIADECYAMANALPELKEVATAVIDSNNDDGLAKWIEANC
jgi:Cof subfamily protein (haloacid dehalogenase superfamily)